MNNEEKIEYLNNIIYKKLNLDYGGPTSLFKYRPFDKFTFDMLEKNYIYCCPADKEDMLIGMDLLLNILIIIMLMKK